MCLLVLHEFLAHLQLCPALPSSVHSAAPNGTEVVFSSRPNHRKWENNETTSIRRGPRRMDYVHSARFWFIRRTTTSMQRAVRSIWQRIRVHSAIFWSIPCISIIPRLRQAFMNFQGGPPSDVLVLRLMTDLMFTWPLSCCIEVHMFSVFSCSPVLSCSRFLTAPYLELSESLSLISPLSFLSVASVSPLVFVLFVCFVFVLSWSHFLHLLFSPFGIYLVFEAW